MMPRWVPYLATVSLALVLCLTINFRAFTELSREVNENESLNSQIESITTENLNLQEEIYYLKNDTDTIEREAKKYGLVRPKSKLKLSSQVGEMGNAEEPTNRQPPTRK
jgi:cell division protein FtsL